MYWMLFSLVSSGYKNHFNDSHMSFGVFLSRLVRDVAVFNLLFFCVSGEGVKGKSNPFDKFSHKKPYFFLNEYARR